MSWIDKIKARRTEKGENKNCQHIHWVILGSNEIGCGHCNDCGREVFVDTLINNTIERLRKAAKETLNKEI